MYVRGDGIQLAHLVLIAEMTMMRIPAGSFRMGCVSGRGCYDAEKPVHTVHVPAFGIGQYEVTFDEWDACVTDGGCSHKPDDEGWGRGNRPVMNVSWDDTQEYVEDRRYRRPILI